MLCEFKLNWLKFMVFRYELNDNRFLGFCDIVYWCIIYGNILINILLFLYRKCFGFRFKYVWLFFFFN